MDYPTSWRGTAWARQGRLYRAGALRGHGPSGPWDTPAKYSLRQAAQSMRRERAEYERLRGRNQTGRSTRASSPRGAMSANPGMLDTSGPAGRYNPLTTDGSMNRARARVWAAMTTPVAEPTRPATLPIAMTRNPRNMVRGSLQPPGQKSPNAAEALRVAGASAQALAKAGFRVAARLNPYVNAAAILAEIFEAQRSRGGELDTGALVPQTEVEELPDGYAEFIPKFDPANWRLTHMCQNGSWDEAVPVEGFLVEECLALQSDFNEVPRGGTIPADWTSFQVWTPDGPGSLRWRTVFGFRRIAEGESYFPAADDPIDVRRTPQTLYPRVIPKGTAVHVPARSPLAVTQTGSGSSTPSRPPRGTLPRRPMPGERERKRVGSIHQGSPLGRALNAVTESTDYMQCAFKALPGRRRAGVTGTADAARRVWQYYREIDVDSFLSCVALNHLEDWVIGKTSGAASRSFAKATGRPIGIGSGPWDTGIRV